MTSKPSPVQRSIAAAKLLAITLLLAQSQATSAQNKHTLPLVLPASGAAPGGLVRILNRSDRAGTVRIHAFDDAGEQFGPVTLSMDANETVNFSSTHLESGNESKGLSGGVGDGQGHWRLELDTDLDIEPLSYARNADGSLSSIHEIVANQSMRHHVLTFNPASNLTKRSLLRLVNTSGIDTDVVITGLDDQGEAPPGGEVRLTLPAGQARTLSVQALEAGGDGFEGRFGDGAGKWQVFVSADRPLQVMSLLSSTGSLHNLSTPTADGTIRGGPGNDVLSGGNRDDVLDPGDNDDGVDIVNGSRGDDRIVYTGSGPSAAQELRYSALSAGITATIDGPANRATVDKGTAGTDTLVDVANPLRAGTTPPFGDFRLSGTPFNDTFILTLDGQWMMVEGGAGADTFNIVSGAVGLDYEQAPGGISVDLGAGQARNDGHGAVDTINGRVRHIRGSEFRDVITGSGNDESFMGRQGNDVIDGGGGVDSVLFLYRGRPDLAVVENLNVDLGRAGPRARGTAPPSPTGFQTSKGYGAETATTSSGAMRATTGSMASAATTSCTAAPATTDSTAETATTRSPPAAAAAATGSRALPATTGSFTPTASATGPIKHSATRRSLPVESRPRSTAPRIAPRSTRGLPAPTPSWTSRIPWEPTVSDCTARTNADVFNLRLRDSRQWMQVEGRAGDDTINVQSDSHGGVRINYHNAPGGIHVDLGAGRVRNDGHGDSDTINGRVREVRGSDFTDVIIGSGNDESFIGRQGNDRIDGGGGFDRLRFDRSSQAIGNLWVDLDEGMATGTWNGSAFSYTISHIEWVRGSDARDFLDDSAGDDTLEGGGGVDILISGRGGNDTLTGGGDPDIFIIERVGDRLVTITDFRNVVDGDFLWLLNFGLSSHADVLDAATDTDDGAMIDLSSYGGDRILLRGLSVDALRISKNAGRFRVVI